MESIILKRLSRKSSSQCPKGNRRQCYLSFAFILLRKFQIKVYKQIHDVINKYVKYVMHAKEMGEWVLIGSNNKDGPILFNYYCFCRWCEFPFHLSTWCMSQLFEEIFTYFTYSTFEFSQFHTKTSIFNEIVVEIHCIHIHTIIVSIQSNCTLFSWG